MRLTPAIIMVCCLPALVPGRAQDVAANVRAMERPLPRVSIPLGGSGGAAGVRPSPAAAWNGSRAPAQPAAPARSLYPWKLAVTVTVFWVGELPGPNNPTPNTKSSWDVNWVTNFGGYDDPDPAKRVADPHTGDFRPLAFAPMLNPFYIALPYNDRVRAGGYKPEVPRVIPWYCQSVARTGATFLRGRWIQIHRNGRNCYAQWEDCGPWVTDDWQYVFGNSRPRNTRNTGAALDISPAVRDFMGIRSGQQVHWRFVEASQVPHGPWKRYGQPQATAPPSEIEAQRRYLEYLRAKRDQNYQRKSAAELQY